MFMMFLGQVLDFFKDLILGSTIPLILGTLTGLILSIFLFFLKKPRCTLAYLPCCVFGVCWRAETAKTVTKHCVLRVVKTL